MTDDDRWKSEDIVERLDYYIELMGADNPNEPVDLAAEARDEIIRLRAALEGEIKYPMPTPDSDPLEIPAFLRRT